jgi:isoquinoline 1-oxidoreductase
MLYGCMVRPPYYRAKLASVDAGGAERLGARVVRDGDALGVVAPSASTAAKAAKAVSARWTAELLPDVTTLYAALKDKAEAPKPGGPATRYPPLIESGDVKPALAKAATRHESSYTVAPIAHVPLEPRAAIASWEGDKLTVRYGTQAPFLVRKDLAAVFGIPEDNVRVISGDIGGGFGSKQRGEIALEAARLARAAGKPVKLTWTREDEFIQGYLRPAGVVEVRSGMDANGRLVAWDFRDYNAGASGLATPYVVPDYSCTFWRSGSPLRQGSYRSLAAVVNTFARESHMDELAVMTKADPVEFRLRNLDNPRLKAVIETAASTFKWKGAGGMAATLEKGGHLALFVALDTRGPETRVTRMVFAGDFGAIYNPDNLRNQIEGALMMGLGGALFEQIRWNNEQLLNPRLSSYRVPRFSDLPRIEVLLMDRRDIPGAGAGESPITVVAPAIASAIYSATGKRVRSLPLLPALSAM